MSDTEVGTEFRSIGDYAGDAIEKLAIGTVETHQVVDRQSWLAMRARDLTASDVPAICGVSGYKTPTAAWAEKRGLVPAQADSPILRRGRWIEPAIWAAIKDTRPDWEIRPAKIYLRAPAMRLGATPDALAIDPERDGIVLVQGKIVAKPVYRENWLDDAERPIVPIDYQLQTLTETMLAERAFPGTTIHPVVAVLVIDTFTADLEIIPVQRHAKAEQRILQATRDFWRMVDSNQRPAIDPTRDHDTVRALYPMDDGETVDLTGDNTIPALFDERKILGEEISEREDRRKAISTEIIDKIGTNSFALIAGGRKLSAKLTTVGEQHREGYSFRSLREVKAKAGKGK